MGSETKSVAPNPPSSSSPISQGPGSRGSRNLVLRRCQVSPSISPSLQPQSLHHPAWNSVNFDIVIQAPPTGSGNLIRLLASLARADMSAVTPPHLTVELPAEVEIPLEKMLAKFKWPSSGFKELPRANLLSLRHRIPRTKLTEEESSVRFLESFWPTNPRQSHVLVLAPHTEVSPQFFQCKTPGT